VQNAQPTRVIDGDSAGSRRLTELGPDRPLKGQARSNLLSLGYPWRDAPFRSSPVHRQLDLRATPTRTTRVRRSHQHWPGARAPRRPLTKISDIGTTMRSPCVVYARGRLAWAACQASAAATSRSREVRPLGLGAS
jgi:hypothetical protein